MRRRRLWAGPTSCHLVLRCSPVLPPEPHQPVLDQGRLVLAAAGIGDQALGQLLG